MPTRERSEHYVNNKELLEALVVYRTKVEKSYEKNFGKNLKEQPKEERAKYWEGKPKITNYLGECFLKIATHLSYVIDNQAPTNGDVVFQYNLSTGFDISTASYSNNSLNVNPYENICLRTSPHTQLPVGLPFEGGRSRCSKHRGQKLYKRG